MFLPDFDVFCDLLLKRRTATWSLFVLYNKELYLICMKGDGDVNRASVLLSIIGKNQSKCDDKLGYYIKNYSIIV